MFAQPGQQSGRCGCGGTVSDPEKLPTITVRLQSSMYDVTTTRGTRWHLSVWFDHDLSAYLWHATRWIPESFYGYQDGHNCGAVFATHESAYADAIGNIGWIA